MVFWLAHRACVGIARSIWEKQARIQGAATDARCCPLTLLLCFIEAIEVAFPRQAPRIFLSVNSPGGQGNSDTQCTGCNRRKSGCSNSDLELSKRFDCFGLNRILGHVFSRIDTRLDCFAEQKTWRENVLFQLSGLSFVRSWNDCVRAPGNPALIRWPPVAHEQRSAARKVKRSMVLTTVVRTNFGISRVRRCCLRTTCAGRTRSDHGRSCRPRSRAEP